MAETEATPPKKSSTTGTIIRVVILVGVIAAVVSMWLHGKKLGAEHAKRLGKPDADAAVSLPWDWSGPEWKSWVGSGGEAAVSSSR